MYIAVYILGRNIHQCISDRSFRLIVLKAIQYVATQNDKKSYVSE